MKWRNFFRGMGSILNLYPRTPALKLKQRFPSVEAALKSDWEKVIGKAEDKDKPEGV